MGLEIILGENKHQFIKMLTLLINSDTVMVRPRVRVKSGIGLRWRKLFWLHINADCAFNLC